MSLKIDKDERIVRRVEDDTTRSHAYQYCLRVKGLHSGNKML